MASTVNGVRTVDVVRVHEEGCTALSERPAYNVPQGSRRYLGDRETVTFIGLIERYKMITDLVS